MHPWRCIIYITLHNLAHTEVPSLSLRSQLLMPSSPTSEIILDHTSLITYFQSKSAENRLEHNVRDRNWSLAFLLPPPLLPPHTLSWIKEFRKDGAAPWVYEFSVLFPSHMGYLTKAIVMPILMF